MKKISRLILPAMIIFGVMLFGFTACQKSPLVIIPPAQESQIVELRDGDTYELTAAPVKKVIGGKEQNLIAYNGMLPGPTLRVQQGATIKVLFRNNTNMPNTIHSHGVRMDNASDGIPDVTQKPVAPGDTFLYTLHFPDAGAYWYHPHMSEPENQESGLFGNFIVLPNEKNQWSDTVDREVPLFFHDMLTGADGEMVSFGGKNGQYTLMGRYGNKLMVNWDEKYALRVKKGEIIRFYMTNASNARPYNITLDGVKLKRVGADNGAYEQETWENHIILGPSERTIVEARFDKLGTFILKNSIPQGDKKLGEIIVTEDPAFKTRGNNTEFDTLHTSASALESIDPFRASFDKTPDKNFTLSLTMGGLMADHMKGMGNMNMGGMMDDLGDNNGGIEWDAGDGMMQMMNQMSDTKNVTWKIIDDATKKENMGIHWDFKKGDQVKIHITNDPKSPHPMQHPIHFHGQRFLVTSIDGRRNENLVWKDTVLIPSGHSVDILLDASNPGDWMAHCHISEHLESGMMLNFSVQ